MRIIDSLIYPITSANLVRTHRPASAGPRRDLATHVVSEPAKSQEHLALLDRHEPFRDFVYKRKIGDDRERVLSVSGSPLLDNAGRFLGYRGTARDVTEKVLADCAVQRAAAEAANSAKSQFLTI